MRFLNTLPLRRRAIVKLLLTLVGLLAISYLALVSVRAVIAYRDVIEAKDILISAEGTLDDAGLDVTSDELDDVEARLRRARGKVESASGFLSHDPSLWVARRLPWIGGQINAARELAQIGLDGADTGMDGVQILRKLLAVKDEGTGPLGQKAMRFLDDVEPEIERIEGRLGEMRAMQEKLQSRTLIAPLSSAVDELEERIARIEDLAETYRRAQVLVPGLLGQERPMTYLVLGQDNTEIAATGGLILSYGVVTIDKGEVTDMFFEGTEEQIARWQEATGGEYVEPPAPLKRYLLRKYTWNLGTANWSPDFPTAAQQAEFFYLRGGGKPIDGVIAIDFIAMEELLEVLGPIDLAQYDAIVDAQNVTELVLERTRRPQSPGEPQKAFAAEVAKVIIERTLAVDSDLWGSLLKAITDIGEERHFLMFAKDDELQSAVEGVGWAGEIKSPDGDYLMIVDASVRSTKLNLILEQNVTLEIDIGSDGSVGHRVTIVDRNPFREWAKDQDPDLVSKLMRQGVYGSFLRLLVPPEAQLTDVVLNGRSVGAEDIRLEGGQKSLGRFFKVPPDETTTITFDYRIPEAASLGVAGSEYRLLLQKQAGVRRTPITIDITLPQGAKLLHATLGDRDLSDGILKISAVLTADTELVVTFERQ